MAFKNNHIIAVVAVVLSLPCVAHCEESMYEKWRSHPDNDTMRVLYADFRNADLNAKNEFIEHLLQDLKENNEDIKTDAIVLLSNLCRSDLKQYPNIGNIIPALILSLKDPDYFTRQQAASALGGLGSAAKDSIPLLIEALDDDYVRSEAAFALGQMGSDAKQAVPDLIRILEQKKEGVRLANSFEVRTIDAESPTIEALGNIGPAAKVAIPILSKYRFNKEPYLRAKADEALKKIKAVT